MVKSSKGRRKFLTLSVTTSVAVASSSLLVPMGTSGKVQAAGNGFSDLTKDHYASLAIYQLVEKGIVTGYPDGTFKPEKHISRMETAILISRMLKLEGGEYRGYFSDVPADSMWSSIIEATKDAGIFKGDSGKFNPNAIITREQLASILVRAFELKEIKEVEVNFSDIHTVSPSHKKDVEILFQNGITIGDTNNRFSPKNSVTRAQISLFLTRALNQTGEVVGDKGSQQENAGSGSQGGIVPSVPSSPGGNEENQFKDGQTYNGDITISPKVNQVYGARSIGYESIVNGNVHLAGNISGSVTLQNLIINGTLTLDPGDLGSVALKNIKATRIEIHSGKKGTIHLNQVDSEKVLVTDDNGIRLKTDGTSTVSNIEVSPANATDSDIELEGNFNEATVRLVAGTKLTANKHFAAKELVVEPSSPDQEIHLISGTGDFADVKDITVNKASTIHTVGETRIQQINLNMDNSDQMVSLYGELSEAELLISKPASLFIGATLNKVNIQADVKIDGEPERISSIRSFEKSNNVNITPATRVMEELFTVIKDQMVRDAIGEIRKLPTQVGLSEIASIQNATKLVNSALAFGANKSDFVMDGIDYYSQLKTLENSISQVMDALVDVKNQLKKLTTQPENIQAIALESLQAQIDAVETAISKAQSVGVTQKDIEKVDHYSRLEPAKVRASELVMEREEAYNLAVAKVTQLPENQDITFKNFLVTKELFAEAKTAIAEAKAKGVTFTDLVKLEEIESTLKLMEEEKKNAIDEVNQKIAALPKRNSITFQNIEDIRALANEIQDLIAAAYEKTAVDKDFTQLERLKDAENKISELDEETRKAILAANEALAQLPETNEMDFSTLKTDEVMVLAAKKAIEEAKAKNAKAADFVGLDILAEVEAKLMHLLKQHTDAIENANKLLASIPDASEITFANLAENQALIEQAKIAINEAMSKGADQKDFKNYDRFIKAEGQLAILIAQQTSAIKAANIALESIPEQSEITFANFRKVSNDIEIAKEAIADAKKKGAEDRQLIGLEKIMPAEDKVSSLFTEMNAAIEKAILAISSLPSVEAITYETFGTHFESVTAARKAVEAALDKGARLEELEHYKLLVAAEEKIESLIQGKLQAINEANHALTNIPNVSQIELKNIEKVQQMIDAAILAVQSAKEKGAVETDFINLEKIDLAKEKINSILKEKSVAIAKAIDALASLPSIDGITEANASDVRAKANLTKKLIEEAISLGALESEILGMEKLEAVFNKLKELEQSPDEAIEQANAVLDAIQTITDINEDNAQNVYHLYLEAYLAIAKAKSMGAEDKDFHQTAFAKYKTLPELLKPFERVRTHRGDHLEILAFINENLDNFKVNDLRSVVNTWVDESLLEDYRAEMIELRNNGIQEFTLGDIAYIVEHVNSRSNQNQNIDEIISLINSAPEQVSIEDLRAVSWLFDGAFEFVRQELISAVSQGNLSVDQIRKIITERNEEYALKYINEHSTSFEFEYLSWMVKTAAVHSDYLKVYRSVITSAINNNGLPLTEQEITSLVNTVNVNRQNSILIEINKSLPNVSWDTISQLTYISEWAYQQFIAQLVYIKSESQRELTIQDINEARNRALQKLGMDYINQNSDRIDFYVLEDLGIEDLKLTLYKEYREAIAAAKLTHGDLTLNLVKAVIKNINENEVSNAVKRINSNPKGFSFADLRLITYSAKYEYLISYRNELAKKIESGPLTLNDIRNIVDFVHQSMALARINEDPEHIRIEDLGEATSTYIDPGLFPYYQQAITNRWQESSKAFTIDELKKIINEIQINIEVQVLAEIIADPSKLTIEKLRQLNIWGEEQYLEEYRRAILSLKETLPRDLTKEDIDKVVRDVRQSEALKRVNQNPLTFDKNDFIQATNGHVTDMILSYLRTAVNDARIKKGEDLTIDELIQIYDQVISNMRNIAIAEINANPSKATIELLVEIAGEAKYEYLKEYQQALIKLKQEIGILSGEDIRTAIVSVNKEKILAFLNSNAQIVEFNDLAILVDWQADEKFHKQYIQSILNHPNYGVLTLEEVMEIVNEVNGGEGLQYIINNIATFESYDLAQVIGWDYVQYDFIEHYRKALVTYLESQNNLTIKDLTVLIQGENERLWLEEINNDISSVDYNILYNLFRLDYVEVYELVKSEYVNYYQTALQEEFNNNGELSKEKVKQIIEMVNEEQLAEKLAKKLEPILDKPDEFTKWELGNLVGYDNVLDSVKIEHYRAVVKSMIPAGEKLTAEEVITGILNFNESVIQEYIDKVNQNDATLTVDELYELAAYGENEFYSFNWNLFDAYKGAISEKVSAGTILTAEDIRTLIIKVNIEIDERKLALINGNPSGFTIEELEDLFDYSIAIGWYNLELYHLAVSEKVDLYGPLTVDQIRAAIIEANKSAAQTAITAINQDPINASFEDIQRISINDYSVYADAYYLDLYQVHLYYHVRDEGSVTVEDVLAVLGSFWNFNGPIVKVENSGPVTDKVEISAPGTGKLYIIPKALSSLSMSEEELHRIIGNNEGIVYEEFYYQENIDITDLPSGEYVAFLVNSDNDTVSYPTKSFQITGSSNVTDNSIDEKIESKESNKEANISPVENEITDEVDPPSEEEESLGSTASITDLTENKKKNYKGNLTNGYDSEDTIDIEAITSTDKGTAQPLSSLNDGSIRRPLNRIEYSKTSEEIESYYEVDKETGKAYLVIPSESAQDSTERIPITYSSGN